jgi:hypothetical protein
MPSNASPPTPQGRSPRGTRVRRGGLAVVHDGELVVPADASEAEVEGLQSEQVQYFFPIEIEVRTPAASVDPDEIVARVLDQLAHGIRNA